VKNKDLEIIKKKRFERMGKFLSTNATLDFDNGGMV